MSRAYLSEELLEEPVSGVENRVDGSVSCQHRARVAGGQQVRNARAPGPEEKVCTCA